MIPPFNRRVTQKISDSHKRFSHSNSNGDVLSIEHAVAQCSGRLIALVSQGVLFRGAFDYDMRVKLINNNLIDAAIQLPSKLMLNTNIPTVILIIDHHRNSNDPVLFYDADHPDLTKSGGRGRSQILFGWKRILEDVLNKKTSPFGVLIDKNEIKNNSYDLSVRKYVLGSGTIGIRELKNTQPLIKIAELIRGQLLKEDKTPEGDLYFEAGVKDIGVDGILLKPKRKLRLSGRMKDRADFQRLQTGDILLITKGSVGRHCIVGDNCEDNWVTNQNFQVIRLTHTNFITDPIYLFQYLSSTLVQTYLNEQVTGTGIPLLKTADIKELPIPIIPLNEQTAVVNNYNQVLSAYHQIKAIEEKIGQLKNTYWTLSEVE